MPLNEAEVLERKTAIGGSDVKDLLTLEPFGCARKLWYDKKGVPEDYPFTGNKHTRRGAALEPHAASDFAAKVGCAVEPLPWRTLQGYQTFIGVHIDGMLVKPGEDGPGALEVKVPTSRVYYQWKAKGEPSLDSQAQLQWAMMVHGFNWGYVTAFNADRWESHWWRCTPDRPMMVKLLGLAERFWGSLSLGHNPHPKLPREDRRCRQCPFRAKCQRLGAEADPDADLELPVTQEAVQDESIFDLVAAYLAAQRLHKDADNALDDAKQELLARIKTPGVVECSLGRVRLSLVRRPEQTRVVAAAEYYQLRVTPREAPNDDDFTLE